MISSYLILIFLTVIWILYLEINPKIRGIWLRPNSDGIFVFCPSGIINLMKAPLTNKHLWNIKLLDINYYTFLIINLIIINYFKKIKYNENI